MPFPINPVADQVVDNFFVAGSEDDQYPVVGLGDSVKVGDLVMTFILIFFCWLNSDVRSVDKGSSGR